MTVFCDNLCWHCRKGECDLDYLSISDGECEDYDEFPGDHKEYQSEYWISWKHKETGEGFRRKRHGLRYERNGFVFFTEDDIRDDIEKAFFTEETSGVGMWGTVFTKPGMFERFEALVKEYPNVMSCPEVDESL